MLIKHLFNQGFSQKFLAQRRKDAKKNRRNAAALCVFVPLREKSSSHKALFVQSLQPEKKH
jgi:hypothetical protein